MKITKSLILISAIVFAKASLAHSDYLHTMTGSHGGKMEQAVQYRIELCLRSDEINVYVADHERNGVAVETKDASVMALVTSGSGTQTIEMQPSDGNLLKATQRLNLAPDTEIVVRLVFPQQTPVQAVFRRARIQNCS